MDINKIRELLESNNISKSELKRLYNNPKQIIEGMGQNLVDIYNEMEMLMIINIARELKLSKSAKDLIPGSTEEQRFVSEFIDEKLSRVETLRNKNENVIRILSRRAPEEVEEFLIESGIKSALVTDNELEEAMEKGAQLIRPINPIGESETAISILQAYEAQALSILNLTNTTLLNNSEQKYRDIINQTAADVLTGKDTIDGALRRSVREMSNEGIPALIDRSGRKWGPEGYVNMVLRTTSTNVTNEMQEARMDEWGSDLVEVSSHADARPKCAPYQGRIYSRSGTHPKYPPLDGTSIGEPDGLFGINCRHVQYPFFEGISVQRFKPYNLKEVEKAYEQSQKQRAIERSIRKAKTNLRAMEALGDDIGIQKAKGLVRARQATMRAFINESGRTRRYNREQIHH